MTTIVAVQGPGWAVVGSDSRITDEGRVYTMSKGYGKIVKNDEYLFGAAGDMRAINILEYAFTPPDANGLYGRELDAFITNEFVPALRKCFEDQGYADRTLAQDIKEAASQGSMILVVVNGTIYELGEDYAWVKDATGLYGMGTGGDYALGALYAYFPVKNKLTVDTAKDIIKEALVIGAKLDSGSGGPFTVLAQLKDE